MRVVVETKTKMVPKETVTAVTQCDLCGKRTRVVPEHDTSEDWTEDNFDFMEIEVRKKKGTLFPEGGGGEQIQFDLCPTCFDEKLIPWMRSQGAQAEWQDWDV